MQRLFSNFANGWPGWGLLLQRVLMTALLVHYLSVRVESAHWSAALPQTVAAVLSILILAGLWTPIIGILICCTETWIVFSGTTDLWTPLILIILGASLAMIGPGAWSIDARLFGRKHIETAQL